MVATPTKPLAKDPCFGYSEMEQADVIGESARELGRERALDAPLDVGRRDRVAVLEEDVVLEREGPDGAVLARRAGVGREVGDHLDRARLGRPRRLSILPDG